MLHCMKVLKIIKKIKKSLKKKIDFQKGSLKGPSYLNKDIENYLTAMKIVYSKPKFLEKKVAKLLSEQKIIGWFSGAMEFGPRALGNRSILADPRDNKMQKTLNLKTKFRESFRPFAPLFWKRSFKMV